MKELHSFIGMVNFYRHMYPQRSHHLAPLTALTGKKTFEWFPQCQKAFENVKAMLAHDAFIRYPDHNIPFHVYVDASDYQLGAVIMQETSLSRISHASSTPLSGITPLWKRSYSPLSKPSKSSAPPMPLSTLNESFVRVSFSKNTIPSFIIFLARITSSPTRYRVSLFQKRRRRVSLPRSLPTVPRLDHDPFSIIAANTPCSRFLVRLMMTPA